MNGPFDKSNPRRFFIGLVIGSALIMTVSALADLEVTEALGRHAWQGFIDFMGRTLFEGEAPGANDPLVLLLLSALVVYLAGWLRPHHCKLAAFRPQAGFILISALVLAFLLMHLIKLSLGRARPDLVLNHGWPFTPWFTLGPHFIGDGPFRGSFPSGHTSQAFTSMALAYAFFCDPCAGRRLHLLGAAWGLVALCFSLLMGLARCMSLSHWLSDVTGAICLGWIAMHGIYYYLLLVPAQRTYYQRHGSQLPMPLFWELRMGGWLTALAQGLLVLFNGLRALWLGRTLWLAWCMPVGLVLIYASARSLMNLRHKLASGLAAPVGQS